MRHPKLTSAIVTIVAMLLAAIGSEQANTKICGVISKIPKVGKKLAGLIYEMYNKVHGKRTLKSNDDSGSGGGGSVSGGGGGSESDYNKL